VQGEPRSDAERHQSRVKAVRQAFGHDLLRTEVHPRGESPAEFRMGRGDSIDRPSHRRRKGPDRDGFQRRGLPLGEHINISSGPDGEILEGQGGPTADDPLDGRGVLEDERVVQFAQKLGEVVQVAVHGRSTKKKSGSSAVCKHYSRYFQADKPLYRRILPMKPSNRKVTSKSQFR
jgi:hypothetical protein